MGTLRKHHCTKADVHSRRTWQSSNPSRVRPVEEHAGQTFPDEFLGMATVDACRPRTTEESTALPSAST